MQRRRNPGLVDDLVLVGVVGGVLWFGGTWLLGQARNIPLPTIPIPSVPNPTAPGGILGPPTTDVLCGQILNWRQNFAGGIIFGIGAKNPCDWQAFCTFLAGPQGAATCPQQPPYCWYDSNYGGANCGGQQN